MNPYLLNFLLGGALGAMVTWSVTYEHFQHEIDRINQEGVSATIEALEKQHQVEQDLYFSTREVEGGLYDEIDSINSTFDLYLSDDWLHNESGRPGETALSEDAGNTGSVQTCECRCDVKNSAEFQKLYEQQMTVARDCDINAAHLNSLIKMVNEWNSKLNTAN